MEPRIFRDFLSIYGNDFIYNYYLYKTMNDEGLNIYKISSCFFWKRNFSLELKFHAHEFSTHKLISS